MHADGRKHETSTKEIERNIVMANSIAQFIKQQKVKFEICQSFREGDDINRRTFALPKYFGKQLYI